MSAVAQVSKEKGKHHKSEMELKDQIVLFTFLRERETMKTGDRHPGRGNNKTGSIDPGTENRPSQELEKSG